MHRGVEHADEDDDHRQPEADDVGEAPRVAALERFEIVRAQVEARYGAGHCAILDEGSAASRGDAPVPGLNTEDWLYEVGKGWVAEGFDGQLLGAKTGAQLTFSATPTGTTEAADFTVAVKNVQEMQLPELTDAWVSENLDEFETVQEIGRAHV